MSNSDDRIVRFHGRVPVHGRTSMDGQGGTRTARTWVPAPREWVRRGHTPGAAFICEVAEGAQSNSRRRAPWPMWTTRKPLTFTRGAYVDVHTRQVVEEVVPWSWDASTPLWDPVTP